MAVVVIDTIKPKNNGTFPVVEAPDVKVTNDKRLDAALNDKANQSDVTALQTAVAGKASQSDLTALSNTVADKADKTALAETNAAVAGKQAALSESQLAAANSGITTELVTQIGTNTAAIATTNAAVEGKADATDVATETASLQAQIDAIVTPVTQDAEVQNARVDAEGVSHATLKARIDSTENTLNDFIEDTNDIIIYESVNRFDPSLQTAQTIDPHFYFNGEPYSTTEYDSQYNCSAPFEVEPSTQYTIGLVPAVNNIVKPWNLAPQGIFFYDSSMNYINKTDNNTFTTPANAKYARFNYNIGGGITLTDIQTKVMLVYGSVLPDEFSAFSIQTIRDKMSQADSEISDINDIVIYHSINDFDSSLQTAETIDPHFYYEGEPYESTQFDDRYNATAEFEVKANTKYTLGLVPAVNGIIKPWNDSPQGIFFYDSAHTYISKASDSTFTTPINAKYARFNYNIGGGITLTEIQKKVMLVKGETLPSEYTAYGDTTVKDKIAKIESQICAKIKCIVDNDRNGLAVIAKYDSTHDVVYELRKKGGNNLFDFHKIGLISNTSKELSGTTANAEYLLNTSSDWHAPFKVSAVNNKNGDNVDSHYFTGGNHQYNNEGSGSTPTARCTNLKFYADNMEFNTDTECSQLELVWENYVQAYDTTKADGSGREVLKEIHHLYFDGITWKSKVDLYPIEDVTMEQWYGFQWFGATTVYKNIRYIGGTSREYKDGSEHTTWSGNATASKMNAYGTTNSIDMWLEPDYDLGDLSFFDSSALDSIFTTDYGKGYFNIIKNKSLSEHNYYSVIGYYKFSSVR